MSFIEKIRQSIEGYPFIYRPAIVLSHLCFSSLYNKRKIGGGTDSAEYCYSVFLRHSKSKSDNGEEQIPERVAELGPGSSIGVGLCFLLAGANQYYAFDAIEHASTDGNIGILNELVNIFRSAGREISDDRISLIRDRLTNPAVSAEIEGNDDIVIKYVAPWQNYGKRLPDVDLFFSQAVLEHVDELDPVYAVIAETIRKRKGIISHVIDLKSHLIGIRWNEHWAFSDTVWKMLRSRRPYLINREPLSTHINLLEKYGYNILKKEVHTINRPSIRTRELKGRFKNMQDDDFSTSECYLTATLK